MKRTKQIEKMIENVNEYLKNNHVKDPCNSEAAWLLMNTLIDLKCYHGYNFYTKDGKLSGGVDTDYFQIY